jgi:hypothetical protein
VDTWCSVQLCGGGGVGGGYAGFSRGRGTYTVCAGADSAGAWTATAGLLIAGMNLGVCQLAAVQWCCVCMQVKHKGSALTYGALLLAGGGGYAGHCLEVG